MSLMNDMLRDLDKRQAPDRSQQVEAQGYGALTQQTPSHGSRIILILLGVIIIMLLLLAMAWWYLQSSDQDNTAEPASANQIAEFTAAEVVSTEKTSVVPIMAENKPKPEPKPKPKPKPAPIVVKPVVKSVVKPETDTLDIENPGVVDSEKEELVVSTIATTAETKAAVQVKEKVKPVPKIKPKQKMSKVVVLSPEQQDEKAASIATKMLQNGEVEKASTYLYQFIEQHGVDAQSRAVLVGHLINNRQMTAADNLLNSTDINQSSHLRRLRAHWYSANNQPDEAIAVLNSLVPDVEADVEYHVLLAALYQQQGYGTEAVARYAELIRYNSEMPDWWVGMAIGLDRSEQYSSAAKAYKKALQMDGLRVELADFAKLRLDILSE